MRNHPLFALPDEEFEEYCLTAPGDLLLRFRDARKDETYSADLLALWDSLRPPEGFRWPWPHLHEKVNVVLKGDWAAVVAQTGTGKTTFVGSLLNQVPPTCRVLVFPTEIKDVRYLTALAARRAGLHPDKVILGLWSEAGWRLSEEEAKERFRKAMDELQSLPVFISRERWLKGSTLWETLERECEIAVPDLIVLDHLQAITHDTGVGINGLQATLETLQAFNSKHGVSGIVTNQVHVRGQGAPANPTDCVHLAGVFGGQLLGQVCSQVIGVHRCIVEQTATGLATTPAFLREYQKSGGDLKLLWDRTKAAFDLCKVRYDAHAVTGQELRMDYHQGQYWTPGTHSRHPASRTRED